MNCLIFSDLHLNKFPYSNVTKEGDNEILVAGLNIIDQVYDYASKYGINYIFFLGDLLHIRSKLDSGLYSNLLYKKLKKYFSDKDSPILILIPGNHDQINKSGTHTLLPFSEIRNVSVVDTICKKSNIILCPHQYDISVLYEFLALNSDDNSVVLMHQLLINTPLMNGAIFRKNEAVDTTRFKFKSLFCGHNHRPFENKALGIYNVGSPMHYDFGDAECQKRYFIHYVNGEVKWVETDFPRFAVHGTVAAKEASYIKRKSKKVQKISQRVNMNFTDDTSSIVKVYVESEDSLLDKEVLVKEGIRLLGAVKEVR